MSDWIDPKKKSISQQRAESSLYSDDLDEEQSDGGLAKVETREALIEKGHHPNWLAPLDMARPTILVELH